MLYYFNINILCNFNFLLFCLASHGCWKEGYLVFTPGEIKLQSGPPQQSSYILTLEDILHLKLRAKIVVLNVGYGPNRSKECIPPGFALPSAFLNAGKKLKALSYSTLMSPDIHMNNCE